MDASIVLNRPDDLSSCPFNLHLALRRFRFPHRVHLVARSCSRLKPVAVTTTVDKLISTLEGLQFVQVKQRTRLVPKPDAQSEAEVIFLRALWDIRMEPNVGSSSWRSTAGRTPPRDEYPTQATGSSQQSLLDENDQGGGEVRVACTLPRRGMAPTEAQTSQAASHSSFTGVWRVGKKWIARIKGANRALVHLGSFESELEAAQAYDAAAFEAFTTRLKRKPHCNFLEMYQ